jgi:hypothetical protein
MNEVTAMVSETELKLDLRSRFVIVKGGLQRLDELKLGLVVNE